MASPPLTPSQATALYIDNLINLPQTTRAAVKAELQAPRGLLNRILRVWDDDGAAASEHEKDHLCLTLQRLKTGSKNLHVTDRGRGKG